MQSLVQELVASCPPHPAPSKKMIVPPNPDFYLVVFKEVLLQNNLLPPFEDVMKASNAVLAGAPVLAPVVGEAGMERMLDILVPRDKKTMLEDFFADELEGRYKKPPPQGSSVLTSLDTSSACGVHSTTLVRTYADDKPTTVRVIESNAESPLLPALNYDFSHD